MRYHLIALISIPILMLTSCTSGNTDIVIQNNYIGSGSNIDSKSPSNNISLSGIQDTLPTIVSLPRVSGTASGIIVNQIDITGLDFNLTTTFDPSYFISSDYKKIRGLHMTDDNKYQAYKIISNNYESYTGQVVLLNGDEWKVPGNPISIKLLNDGTPFLISDSNYYNKVNIDGKVSFEKVENNSGSFIKKIDYFRNNQEEIITPLLSSISNVNYTKNLDAYYLGGLTQNSIFGKLTGTVNALFKNKENISQNDGQAPSAITSYYVNSSGSLLAYIGEKIDPDVTNEIAKYEYGTWCFDNIDMILGTSIHQGLKNSRQYLRINNDIYNSYPIYGIIGSINDELVWVGCDFTKHYSHIYRGDKLIDGTSRIVSDPAIINNYILFESEDLEIPGEVEYPSIEIKHKGGRYLILLDLINGTRYKLSSTKKGYGINAIMYSENLRNYIIFKEINLSTREERIVSISPEKLIELSRTGSAVNVDNH